MARVELNIVALGDFSSVNSQIKALQTQVASLNKNLAGVGLGSQLTKDLAAAQAAFKSTMLSTGQFTLQTVKMASETEKFGAALTAGKLKLSQYFDIITGKSGQAATSLKALVAEQVKLQSSLVMADPTKRGILSVYTPTQINEVTAATKLATMQQNLYNLSVSGASKALLNWGKNTQWAGRQLTVGLTMPMVMFGAMSLKTFQQVDTELTRMQKVYGTGLVQPTKQALDSIRAQVTGLSRELASGLGISAKDTAAMAADLAATGQTGNDLLVATREALRLQKLGEMDNQTAMQTTVSLQNVYKLSTQDLSSAVNFLNAVENQTSTSLQDLAAGIPKVGPIVQQLGGSFKDTAVMMVAMKEAGVPAAQSANAIKSALASLINPTKSASDAFAKYNINLGAIATETGGNPVKMIVELQKALKGLEPLAQAQLIEKLFGKFQQARIQALITNLGSATSQTRTVFDLMAANNQQLASIAQGELKTATESTTGKWQRAVESFKATIVPVGQKFMELGTMVLNIADKIGKAFSHLPGPVKSILGVFAGVSLFAGPIIMLTGLLANFASYILKGVVNLRALAKGGVTFKELLTPEIIASQNAAELFSAEIAKDVQAVDLLDQAIKQLTVTLEGMSAAMTAATGPEIANATAVARRQGIYHIMPQADYAAFGYGGKSKEARSKPTTGFYGITDEKLNSDMAKRGVSGERIINAMTAYTGEVENAATMFRTSATDYLNVIAQKTDVAGKSLITEKQSAEINAKINTEYKAWLQTQTLVTDETNQLAAITNKIMMEAAAISENPEEFARMWQKFNTSASLTTKLGPGMGGGGNVIPVKSSIYTEGPNSLVLAGSGTSKFYHAYNEEFFKFREKVITDFKTTLREAGIQGGTELEKALIAKLDQSLVPIAEEAAKVGMAAGTAEVTAMEQRINSMFPAMMTSQVERITAQSSMFRIPGITSANEWLAGFKGRMATGGQQMGMKGMGISMGASMAGMALSGKGGAVGIAGSMLTNVGMGVMLASFSTRLAGVLPEVAAAIAALTLAYKGISTIMQNVKDHNEAVANSFKATGDVIAMFGGTLQDQTIHIHSFAMESKTAVDNLTGIQKIVDQINKLPKDNPLKQVGDLLKQGNTASSVIGTTRQFAAAQVANGMDPAAVKDLVTSLLTYADKTQYLKQALDQIIPSTKNLTIATGTWISKLKSASTSILTTQTSYDMLGGKQKAVADAALLVANRILDSKTSFDTAISLANELSTALGGSASAYQYLALAAQKADPALAKELSKLQSSGASVPEMLTWIKAAGATMVTPGATSEQRKKEILKTYENDLKKQNADIQSANAQAQADYAKRISDANKQAITDKKSVLKLAQDELKTLQHQLKVYQDQTNEMKKQQDYIKTQQDIDSQIVDAKIHGNYILAAQLEQEKTKNAIDFTRGNVESDLQKKIDAQQALVDKLQAEKDAANAKATSIGAKPTMTPLIDVKSKVNDLSKLLNFTDAEPLPVKVTNIDELNKKKTQDYLGTGVAAHTFTSVSSQEIEAAGGRRTGGTRFKEGTFTGQTIVSNGVKYKIGAQDPTTGRWAVSKVTGKAFGGLIKGPGTSMSDSIPAALHYATGGMMPIALSNGEYIQRAAAVQKYGVGFMNAVNSGAYDASSTSNSVYNINMTVNGGNASANEIANQVMAKLQIIQNKNNKTNAVRI